MPLRDELTRRADRHLRRYATSVARLRAVLHRYLDKRDADCRLTLADRQEATLWVEEIVLDAVRTGTLDDKRYAALKLRALRQSGSSDVRIRATLIRDGIAPALLDATFAAAAAEHPNGADDALRRWAEKRGVSRPPYSAQFSAVELRRIRRDATRMLRAGFPEDDVIRFFGVDFE